MFLSCLANVIILKNVTPTLMRDLTVINQNYIHDEINSRLNSVSECYHIHLETFNKVVTIVLHQYETWSLIQREEHRKSA